MTERTSRKIPVTERQFPELRELEVLMRQAESAATVAWRQAVQAGLIEETAQ